MKYFTINELAHSDTAVALGINNNPLRSAVESLTELVEFVLDPLREAYGKPIYVNSGYRSHALNRAVGGAKNSQHLSGEAVDITTGSVEGNKWLFDYIRTNLPFDQLIDERGYSWVHVSFSGYGCNRQQILHL